MFKWFNNAEESTSNNCSNCYYYNDYHSSDKLNSDKTVTKGKLLYEYCHKGEFYLKDTVPCELHKRIKQGEKRTAKIPPLPPKFKDK